MKCETFKICASLWGRKDPLHLHVNETMKYQIFTQNVCPKFQTQCLPVPSKSKGLKGYGLLLKCMMKNKGLKGYSFVLKSIIKQNNVPNQRSEAFYVF